VLKKQIKGSDIIMIETIFNFDTATKQDVRDLFCNHDVNGIQFSLNGVEYTIIDEEAGSKTRKCAPYWTTVFIVEESSGIQREMNICDKLPIDFK
jgi:hypothetical protein